MYESELNIELLKYVKSSFNEYNLIQIKYDDIVFEEQVKMNCFYCGKYNVSWKCPPKLPTNIDFKKMLKEFSNIALLYKNFYFTRENYNMVRNDSSIELHNTLLKMEQFLWNHNCSTALSFIGGSCKLCKSGCGKDKCNNPYKSRSPMEATGMNVIKTAANVGVEIVFPPKDYITRMGMIMW